MALLLDIFGFLSVVLRGIILSAQSLTIGGIFFLTLLVWPLAPQLGTGGEAVMAKTRRLLFWSALTLAFAEFVFIVLECVVLAGTVAISLGDAFGANFARLGLVAMTAALGTAFIAAGPFTKTRVLALPPLAFAMLVAQVATSHAAAQLGNRGVLLVGDFLHMGAAAVWIGGIPYFLMALYQTHDGITHGLVGRRFSLMSMGAVAVLVVAGLVMAVPYIGSIEAIYGTSYGVMVSTKVLLLVSLLFFGAMNNRIVEQVRRDPRVSVLRLRRFAEVEIAIGLTVLFAAASLTSQPPAIDLTTDRASFHEIIERLTPHWPRLESPDLASLAITELKAKIAAAAANNIPQPQAYVPGAGVVLPRNDNDIAWSEYNHNWSGVFVLAIGILALLERSGKPRWARHWPLLFLVLGGFLLIRSDPETWPLGDVGFWASLREPEFVQHRIFVVIIAAYAIFEWRLRNGPVKNPREALVFPCLIWIGAMLLLTHSHALSNIKEQLLIEISHVALALCGMIAGVARWLELRLDEPGSRVASWIWPTAFVLVGVILLVYKEA